MNTIKRTLSHIFLGTVTCLLLVGFSTPALSTALSGLSIQLHHPSGSHVDQRPQMTPIQSLMSHQMASNLRLAESGLMARSLSSGLSSGSLTRYVAVLTREEIVPTTPSTMAFGAAGAVLMGDRLIVRGDFSNMTSPLRDYATDPLDPPNPNITSAVHIHQGGPDVNGPFQYALDVDLTQGELGGRFSGEYTLTGEQQQALSDGMLYLDIHTTRNRGGELRGVLRAY